MTETTENERELREERDRLQLFERALEVWWQRTAIVVGEDAAALACDGARLRSGDPRCVLGRRAPRCVREYRATVSPRIIIRACVSVCVDPGRVILARCRLRNLTCRSVVASAGAIADWMTDAIRADSTVETRARVTIVGADVSGVV